MQTMKRAAVVLASVAVSSLSLIAAGCGSDSPSPSVAQPPMTSTQAPPSEGGSAPNGGDPIAFATCMRAHGVRDFPDPTFSNGSPFPPGIDRSSPRFAAAKRACAGGVTAG
jgi:hypothetical protein